eukprot:381801_1
MKQILQLRNVSVINRQKLKRTRSTTSFRVPVMRCCWEQRNATRNNAESKSIWLHLLNRSNGVADKFLLNWNEDQFTEYPMQFKKDILMYFTLVRNSSFLLKYAQLALPYLSSSSSSDHEWNLCIVYFVIIYLAKNSIVMGERIKLVYDENPQLKHLNRVQFDTMMLLSERIANLQELSLNLLHILNISKSDLYEVDFFLHERYNAHYLQTFQPLDTDSLASFIDEFNMIPPIVEAILLSSNDIKICTFKQFEMDYHDGGLPGNDKKEKKTSDVLYALATKKKVIESCQNAGNDSVVQA